MVGTTSGVTKEMNIAYVSKRLGHINIQTKQQLLFRINARKKAPARMLML